MLRNATSRAAVRRSRLLVSQAPTRRVPEVAAGNSQTSFRSFATSDKKRALDAQQLKGSAKEPPKSGIPPPEAAGSIEAEKSSSLGSGMAVLLAAGGAGAAY